LNPPERERKNENSWEKVSFIYMGVSGTDLTGPVRLERIDIKIRAERRAGKIISEILRVQGSRKGEKGLLSSLETSGPLDTAHRWQAMKREPNDSVG